MKLIKLLYLFVFSSLNLFAQTTLTVDVSTPGTLTSLISSTDKTSVQTLTVTGTIDARDVKCIRDEIVSLSVLNINASIVSYTGMEGTASGDVITYPDAELPVKAFYNLTNLTKVYLSDLTLATIGDSAFCNCTSLMKLSVAAEIPPVCQAHTFENVDVNNCVLEVPYGDIEVYPGEEYWWDFVNVVEKGIQYVTTTSAGTLSTLLDSEEKASVIRLTVSGPIDARDIKNIRDDMPLLSLLDLGDARIESYTGTEGPFGTNNTVYPANQLPAFSFYDGTSGKTTLTDLRMPTTLTSIGQSAFNSCTGINVNLVIPASVNTIGVYAFSGCNQIINEPLNLPASLAEIADGAFQNCSQIKGKLTIPSNVTVVKNSAFRFCTGLSGTLTIPAATSSLGYYAFAGCKNFTKISVGNAVPPVIYETTFDSINKSTCILEVPIGAKLAYQTANYWKDFSNVIEKGLKSFDMTTPGTLTSLLTADEKLYTTNLILSGDIDARDIKCIRNEMAMISVLDLSAANIVSYTGSDGPVSSSTTYPANEMPQSSFYLGSTLGRASLTKVLLPLNLTSIGESAFAYCENIVDSVSVPLSVTNIGVSAFKNCRSFSNKLTIPASVTTIGDYAYSNCTDISTISVKNPIPPVIYANTFQFIDKTTCKLIVPNGAVTDYSLASYWNEFTNISVVTDVNNGLSKSYKVYISDRNICFENAESVHVKCFDISGRCVYDKKLTDNYVSVPLNIAGVYIVLLDNFAQKVIVK